MGWCLALAGFLNVGAVFDCGNGLLITCLLKAAGYLMHVRLLVICWIVNAVLAFDAFGTNQLVACVVCMFKKIAAVDLSLNEMIRVSASIKACRNHGTSFNCAKNVSNDFVAG